ncbi:hypothetical protein VNO77_34350 [Canavalia gladiata]|uniref:Uncharacterized protein n=1 Tax=Canavalia gladiata TaxID=3824 RepID=A0AAN9KG09_CANGL
MKEKSCEISKRGSRSLMYNEPMVAQKNGGRQRIREASEEILEGTVSSSLSSEERTERTRGKLLREISVSNRTSSSSLTFTRKMITISIRRELTSKISKRAQFLTEPLENIVRWRQIQDEMSESADVNHSPILDKAYLTSSGRLHFLFSMENLPSSVNSTLGWDKMVFEVPSESWK